MRFFISLALVASVLVLKASSLSADANTEKLHKTNLNDAAELLNDIPYADEKAAEQNDALALPAGRKLKSTPPAATR